MRRSLLLYINKNKTTPLSRLTRGIREENDIKWLFNFIDVDRSGSIERSELTQLLSVIGKGEGRRLSMVYKQKILLLCNF